MESVHGVDVSWLHRPQKDSVPRLRAPSNPAPPGPLTKDAAATTHTVDIAQDIPTPTRDQLPTPSSKHPAAAAPQDASLESPVQRQPRRPNVLNRGSQDRSGSESGRSPRRASWISNISSRFSSGASPQPGSPAAAQLSRPVVNGAHGTNPQPDLAKHASPLTSPQISRKEAEELQPYVPSRPRESGSSFFSSVARRLSTGSQGSSASTLVVNGGVCPRRTLNVNHHRARCRIPELERSNLKRVSFSVDVEIARGPKYKDDDAAPAVDKARKSKDKKVKERSEGETLKHPEVAVEVKEEETNSASSEDTPLTSIPPTEQPPDENKTDASEPKPKTRKQEKKKKSDDERKERNAKKRRRAEENGTIPVEFHDDDDEDDSDVEKDLQAQAASPPAAAPVPVKPHLRPTTEPVRIYRRCCQLRESPILKRITEQLMSPTCTSPDEPGTVTCLTLTGSRLQLADFVTLGDWLAVVPVKRLLLEDADICDEGLRVVLCGLLASQTPAPTRRRRRSSISRPEVQDRTSIIEKLNLKNNPRITRMGWKHLALFLNMCRSIKAIDLSMNAFPNDLPLGNMNPSAGTPGAALQQDAAELFAKALAERRGGAKLEELMLSECGLDTEKVRKLVDGAIACGVTRLGLAGNDLDDEGYSHFLKYLQSGVCTAFDIGLNDLRDRTRQLAEALSHDPDCPVWGLSLASCNLDTSSLQALFPALVKLKNLRFLDISHNTALFENDTPATVHLLRKYIPLFKNLKRLHLMDVGLNARQAIAIAEVLPEGPTLAHIGLLENSELSKLVTNTDESSQEEACALYASLMAAVRVSSTIVRIDIDVPPPDNSEVVKALARQVVAYSLRNMERMPLNEATAVTAAIEMTQPLEDLKTGDITVPDVLLHLVGHADGVEDHDKDECAPDDDYIVGGTGVVKALQYCLGEKAQEYSRSGSGQTSGYATPSRELRSEPSKDQVASHREEQRGKAKEVSKNLLGSARKIRARLQPALVKEATAGDEMAYRRLVFLDQTLHGMIQRFEDEYPECRLATGGTGSVPSSFNSLVTGVSLSLASARVHRTDTNTGAGLGDSDEDNDVAIHTSNRPSRRGSEVSLASKALSMEEGRMHRIGHGIRQDLLKVSPSPRSPSRARSAASPMEADGEEAVAAEDSDAVDAAAGEETLPEAPKGLEDDEHLRTLTQRLADLSGEQFRTLLHESGSFEGVLNKIGANLQELRALQERDQEAWEAFVESQRVARANMEGDADRA